MAGTAATLLSIVGACADSSDEPAGTVGVTVRDATTSAAPAESTTTSVAPVEPTATSEAPPASEPPITTTTLVALPASLENGTLPAGSCRFGAWVNPEPIPIIGGTGTSGDGLLPDGRYASAEAHLEGPLIPVSLAGIEGEAGLQQLGCGAGGSSMERFVIVVTQATTGLVLVGGGPIVPTALGDTDETGFIESVRVEDGALITTETVPGLLGPYGVSVRWTLAGDSWQHEEL